MNAVEIVLVMFMAVIVSGFVARVLPLGLPLPLIQIALGALIAAASTRGVQLDPNLFFLLFLPPLLFLDGWRIPKEGLLRDRATILNLAFGLVIFTVVGLGLLVHTLIPAMPLPVAFALAAIVSPTDPVAVSEITARVPMPRRVMHVLEGESLLNDASGLVAFRFAVAAALTGSFSLASAALSFLWVTVAGLAVGAGFTWIVTTAKSTFGRRYGEDPGAEILLSLSIPFAAYLIAEHLGASGILAAVAAGITMSYAELSGQALAATRVQRAAVWNWVQFTLNGIMFVLLGEQLPAIFRGAVHAVSETGHRNPWWLLAYAVAINSALALLRFAWVWVSLLVARWLAARRGQHAPRAGLRMVLATSIAGVRGAVTLAGVLTLPLAAADGAAFPARDLAIFLAATVIVLSLVGASTLLPRLLRGLDIPPEASHHAQEDLASEAARSAAIRSIERSLHDMVAAHPEVDPQLYTNVAGRLMEGYWRRPAGSMPQQADAGLVRQQDEIARAMQLAALQAAREELFRLARTRAISDEVCRAMVRRLDLTEARG